MGKNCKNRWLFNENWWFSEGFEIPRIDSSLFLIFLKIHRTCGSLILIFFKIPRSDGSLKNQRTTQHQSITSSSVEIGHVASPHWRRGLGLQPILAAYWVGQMSVWGYVNGDKSIHPRRLSSHGLQMSEIPSIKSSISHP